MKREFSLDTLSKNTEISNCMKILQVIADLFHADRQTDRERDRHDEAKSSYSQFCDRVEKAMFQVY